MAWQPNKEVPLDDTVQKTVMAALADGFETDSGYRLAYVPHEALSGFQDKFGTACGKKGNVFSFGMVELLKKCQYVVMCYQRDGDRVEIGSMALFGITQEEGVKMGLLAQLAGGSFRADVLKVGKDKWVILESE
jgi:hypothetical protein